MLDGTYLQLFGALLFGVVFLFLWRQSKVVYFGFWALAWAVEAAAWFSMLMVPRSSRWVGAHAFFEFGFALSLVAAADVGSRERVGKVWLSALRLLYFFPAFLLAIELVGWNRFHIVGGMRSLVLSAVYFYSFWQLGLGVRKLFHFALLALSLLYLQDAAAYVFVYLRGGPAPWWMAYLNYLSYYDLALKTTLAFAAMGMWIETQDHHAKQIANELDRVRRESTHQPNLDHLTGLLNQDSLQRLLESVAEFAGVVAVCDLDGFKLINDQFGHMVGDEVLRSVGNLVRTSIRAEDRAYRWGGDEFTILFNEADAALAQERMHRLEARLNEFGVRGHGTLQIRISWGVAEGKGLPLRDAVDQADREMYALKRERATSILEGGETQKSPGRPGSSQASSTLSTS